MPAIHGLLGRIQRANDDASRRFGPNTAEVEAFAVIATEHPATFADNVPSLTSTAPRAPSRTSARPRSAAAEPSSRTTALAKSRAHGP